jgi:zinc transport system permease protein
MVDLEIFNQALFLRPLLLGLILSILMSILGVLIVLRKMSFFSDAIGHAALTGIALGLLLNLNPFLSALIYVLLVATAISIIKLKSNLHLDTLLGVFFSASVALGVILIQLTPGYQANLISFLFGNILTVSQFDIVLTLFASIITLTAILLFGKKFIAITFDSSLAKAEGIPVATYDLIFFLLLAGTIALSIKIVGVILVTAMLIIPAASAQNIAKSLTLMFAISIILGLLSVAIGMFSSVILNSSSGPTIVLTGTIFFALSLLLKPFFKTAT